MSSKSSDEAELDVTEMTSSQRFLETEGVDGGDGGDGACESDVLAECWQGSSVKECIAVGGPTQRQSRRFLILSVKNTLVLARLTCPLWPRTLQTQGGRRTSRQSANVRL